jgi:hypothetical protein
MSYYLQANGEGKEDGAVFFLPPGVSMDEPSNDDGTSNVTEDAKQDSSLADSSAEEKPQRKSSNAFEGDWECITCKQINSDDRMRCKQCMGWKGGSRMKKPYLTNVQEVIERVLKSSDETEASAAEAFKIALPDIHDQFASKKKVSTAPAHNSSTAQEHIELDWKHNRIHYPKAESRVGEEYQVSELPTAGTFQVNEQSDM